MKTKVVFCCFVTVAVFGCGRSQTSAPNQKEPKVGEKKSEHAVTFAGLHNVHKLTPKIISGGEPEGEAGFKSLKEMGIKTIVSVDGAKPNLALAKKYGLEYVHIPIGYDGVPKQAQQMLAKLERTREGPFYIHCHHGKHRGPSAAAIACQLAGALDNKGAVEILKKAGTGKNYKGLWRDVSEFKAPEKDAKLPDLVETAQVGSFAAAMSQIDRAFDNIKLCKESGWNVPKDHPDLEPAQQAILLQEGFAESVRHRGNNRDRKFEDWLMKSEANARKLQKYLEMRGSAELDQVFLEIERACKECHRVYRDE